MDRKNFLKQSSLSAAGMLFLTSFKSTLLKRKDKPVILIVSGWQDVNIGDIGHTPGLLHILQKFMPEATLILWKKSNGGEVEKMLHNNFPKVTILYGGVNNNKDADNPAIDKAMQEADLLIHGSGPLLVGADNVACWIKHTGKPFGIFGTTLEKPNQYHQALLKQAAFIFTRETRSIQDLQEAAIHGMPILFAPDATFYINVHNNEKANRFIKDNNLPDKKFIVAVPRLRYTPYHKINPNNNGWNAEKIKQVEETNNKFKEADHAKMRQAMIAWVRETGNKVVVCPEMTYQIDIMDELLINPLPEDVKPFVVKHGYWLPDEAASFYARAHTVISFECHSPIIAAANGTPFFYLRQPEDTIKGQMYYDLGFNDWIFEIENTDGAQITDRLRGIWKNYPAATAILKTGMNKVENIYAERTAGIKKIMNI